MLNFALNHMTVAQASFVELLDYAAALGCVGVEVRNDLPSPLFDGMAPSEAQKMLEDRGLRLLALAEIKAFNNSDEDLLEQTKSLAEIAFEAGAEAISLIPRNDGQGLGNGERQANLRLALRAIHPILKATGLKGLIEPLGFPACALRQKAEALAAITAIGGQEEFSVIHDTFHHHLADEQEIFPTTTGLIHVSGVVEPRIAAADMLDGHRGLVDARDRLGNIDQISALLDAGYAGPISFEAFSSVVHEAANPVADLRRSIDFIQSQFYAETA